MGKVVVLMHLTLDGVMQAPGRPDEDPRDGFGHGGWAARRGATIDMGSLGMGEVGAMLFGRRTYEDFFAFWPHQGDTPYTRMLDAMQKYVASTTLREPLPWQNSTLLAGDVAEAVAGLRAQLRGNLLIMGSGVLVQSLMRHNLIDRYALLIHPLVLGAGRRLFGTDGPPAELLLAGATTTDSGVVVATYEPAREGA